MERGGRECAVPDRKSTRLNSSHLVISYAVFCLKKETVRPFAARSRFVFLSAVSRASAAQTVFSPLNGWPTRTPVNASRLSSLIFFNDTATTEIYTLSLHDALPICTRLNSSHLVISYAVFWSSDVC